MTTQATLTTGSNDAIRAQWDAAAEGWDTQGASIRDWLRQPTALMLEMARVQPGQRVLDVAAGAGDQTLDLALRVGPAGHVVATDLSLALVERLQANARRAGIGTVEARVADAQEPLAEEGAFDAAVCRLGLMLMPDPGRALAAIVDGLKPGAGICAMVFAGPAENPCVRTLMTVALRHTGLPPRDPFAPGSLFSLGRPEALADLFRAAGLEEVVVTRLEAPFQLPSARDYVTFAREAAAPVRAVLDPLPLEARDSAWSEMEAELARFATPEGWEGPNTLLLAAGRRPV